MLGYMVAAWLRRDGFSVLTTETRHPSGDLVGEVRQSDAVAVVNCIGITSKATLSPEGLFSTNAQLPQELAAVLASDRRLLVHASTDGVFDGRRGSYEVNEPTDALDPYGLSKRLGELAVHLGNVIVIRCSIVGFDQGPARSLLSWLLQQPGPIVGHTDHHWNGVTTLEWAKTAARALRGDSRLAPGIHQLACAQPVTKHSLLTIAARVFEHDVAITAHATGAIVDRTLIPTISGPPIVQQLEELKAHSEAVLCNARLHTNSHV